MTDCGIILCSAAGGEERRRGNQWMDGKERRKEGPEGGWEKRRERREGSLQFRSLPLQGAEGDGFNIRQHKTF